MTEFPGYIPVDPKIVATQAVNLGASLQNIHFTHGSVSNGKHKRKDKPGYRQADNSEFVSFSQSNNVCEFLIRTKQFSFNSPSYIRHWAIDQLGVYLWVLGKIDQKPLVEVSFDEECLCSKLPLTSNSCNYMNDIESRSVEELYYLEQALDLYNYRAHLLIHNYAFTGAVKMRLLEKAGELFSKGYIISEPSDDLLLQGQHLSKLSMDELNEVEELTTRRTLALFFALGKIRI